MGEKRHNLPFPGVDRVLVGSHHHRPADSRAGPYSLDTGARTVRTALVAVAVDSS